MNHHKSSRRILAMALSVVMVLGMVPITAAAEELPAGTSGEITAFEKLVDAIATQTVALDTPFEDLDLPETLKATVRLETNMSEPVQDSAEPLPEVITGPAVVLDTPSDDSDLPETLTVSANLATAPSASVQNSDEPQQEEEKQEHENLVQDSGNPKQEEPEQNDNYEQSDSASDEDVPAENLKNPAEDVEPSNQEESDTGYTEMTLPVPVTWMASPDYDGNMAGVYVFTAEISDFTVIAELPVITITVGQAAVKGTITAFDELTDDTRWQNSTKAAELPTELTGTVEGENAQIPVTWEADHDYDSDSPATGLYVFTAKPGEGYTLAEDVELPRITVYIPAVKRMMRLMEGNGTSTSPLEITTAAQLSEIAVLVNSGRLESFLLGDSTGTVSLKLMNDLDLSAYGEGWNSGKGWVPIGTDTNPFKGSFDGNNNEITGLYINRMEDYTGLFSYIKGGTVQNLKLVEVSITGGNTVGGVAGYVDGGSMTNCNVSGSINGAGGVGGVAGDIFDVSVTNCYVTSTVSGSMRVGGVVGDVSGSVTNCYATGAVSGTGYYVGGVAGSVWAGSVTNCYAIGAVSGTGNYVGGVAGEVSGSVTNCAALNPSVSGSSNVGRVAGTVYDFTTLSDNAAFSGMTVKVNNVSQTISGGAADNINGESMSTTTIQTDGTIGGRFADTSIWTVEDGKLPILQNAGGTQDVALPPYLAGDGSSHFLGEGTSAAPYQISTAAQLAKLAELVNAKDTNYNDKYYKLTADISLSAYGEGWNSGNGWIPIGTDTANFFKGTFDGNGKKITGLYIHRAKNYTGLFGYIKGGTVQNLVLELEKVNTGGVWSVGGVVGAIDGSVTNCYVTGAVSGTGRNVGGVAGYVNGSVTNCYAIGAVSGNDNVGGVAGIVTGSVKNCYATGAVSGNDGVGGVAGLVQCSGIGVANCYATGAVSGNDGVGGVAGYVQGRVTNCAALNPSVSGSINVGRVAGTVENGMLSGNAAFSGMTDPGTGKFGSIANSPTDKNGESMSAAEIKADGAIGGRFDDTSIWTAVNGKLPILQNAGGTQDASLPPHLAGGSSSHFLGEGTETAPYQISTAAQLAKLAELVNAGDTSYNDKYYKLTADISLSAYGKNWNSGNGWIPIGTDTTNCFKGSFDGNSKKITRLYINRTEQFSGLFGYIKGGTVQNLGLIKVSITGYYNVGGVAGYVDGSVTNCHVTNCYVTGTVSGTGNQVGGVAGYVSGSVTNCYATGTVSGTNQNSHYTALNVGGVVGYVVTGSVINCYATGAVSSTGNYVGGVAGEVFDGSVTNCYATGAVSGKETVGGVVGWALVCSVTNCAALNPSVSGRVNTGRVVGAVSDDTLSGNGAFSSMTDPGEEKFGSIANNPTDRNGANITSGQMNTASFWKLADNWDTSGWDTTVWTIQDGKLPILTNAGGTQSGDGGLYLTTRDIAGASVTVNGSYTYTGSPITPTLTVTFGGQTLEKDVDYTVSVTSLDGTDTSAGTNTGTVTLSLNGIGSFTGTKTGVTFRIEKLDDRLAPALDYTVSESDFPKTVSITEVSGAEYQFNNGGYSQTKTFTSNSDEVVILYIRLAETATRKASPVTSVTINTANQDQSAPPVFTLTYASVNDASYTVTIPATAGAEYSFDGTTWSGENTKTGNPSGDSITGYKRMAAKPGYNASSITSDSVTLPLFQVKTPTASPNGGTFKASQSVTLTCQTTGAQIYYTIDGSTPTAGSTLYSTPFTLTATTTVNVIAVKTGMTDSGVLSVTFTKQSGGNNGGSNGGGSSSGGSSTSTTTTTPEKKPNQPVTAAASVTATAGTNGAASASIPDKAVTDAIAKAQADAKAQGKTANGISVELNIIMPKETASLTAVLTRSSLDSLVSAGVRSLEINGSLVKVSFDKKALAEIQKQSSGNINIAIAPKTNLSDAAKKIIGTRPIYDITVGYGSGKSVSSFGGGIATVSIPYTLGKNEAVGGLYAVYVDAKGNANRIAGSAYDANSGCVFFSTTHFSQYGIGYTAPTAKFMDISSHWAKESIDYVVGRGLLSGTSETTFAPDTAMTRGMLVTALGRLAGVDAKAYTTNSFTDVNADSAYRPYVEWAYSKGVIQGIGNSQFAPDRAITRGEIAVIFANYAKATGYTLPITREATTYPDASSIGSAYKDAVKAMQQAGIMMGGSDNKFNPKGNATRAEVSSMLTRYIKLTINPATAQGWALNDAGQYLYYKDGKALTGTQTIDGVKYFFNSDGTLKTGWVKDGDNWRYYSGKTMLVGFWDLGANGNNKTYYFTKDGLMVSGSWLEIDGKWYYFYTDGSLARSTKIGGYEVDENGVRKAK